MIMKGQKISDRYQIIKSIGEGGMANVYLAYDTILPVDLRRGDAVRQLWHDKRHFVGLDERPERDTALSGDFGRRPGGIPRPKAIDSNVVAPHARTAIGVFVGPKVQLRHLRAANRQRLGRGIDGDTVDVYAHNVAVPRNAEAVLSAKLSSLSSAFLPC